METRNTLRISGDEKEIRRFLADFSAKSVSFSMKNILEKDKWGCRYDISYSDTYKQSLTRLMNGETYIEYITMNANTLFVKEVSKLYNLTFSLSYYCYDLRSTGKNVYKDGELIKQFVPKGSNDKKQQEINFFDFLIREQFFSLSAVIRMTYGDIRTFFETEYELEEPESFNLVKKERHVQEMMNHVKS